MNNNKNNLVVVNYVTASGEVSLDTNLVRQTIAVGDGVTDSEIYNFMQMCKYKKLNPFLKEAYLVKFSGKCQIITALTVFQQRLNSNPKNEGFELGTIAIDDKGVLHEREGTFYLDDEKLVGAYCILHKRGCKDLKWSVRLTDYMKKIKDKTSGKMRPQSQWGDMPGVMITKCCFTAAVRYYYPEEFGGMYSADELGMNEDEIISIIQPIDEEQINELKNVASSEILKHDTDKFLEWILNKYVEKNLLTTNKIEDIPINNFEAIKKDIESLIKKKEEKHLKEEKKKADEAKKKDEDNKKAEVKENKENTSTKKKDEDTKKKDQEVKTDGKNNK